jgi:hypothetical protein
MIEGAGMFRRAKRFVILALIGIVGILVYQSYLRERLLLERATNVSDMKGWWQYWAFSYRWLSDHEVLYLSNNSSGCQLNSYDTTTRTSTLLRGLTRVHQKFGQSKDYGFTISPDRQWMLWQSAEYDPQYKQSAEHFPRYKVAARIDGSRYVTWSNHGKYTDAYEVEVSWMSDSRHWVDWANKYIYDVNSPHRVDPYKIPAKAVAEWADDVLLLPGDRLLSCVDGRDTTQVVEALLDAPHQPVHRSIIHLPGTIPNTWSHKELLSPDGKQIAWILKSSYASPLQRLLHHINNG